jgi:hypothetical protein
MTPCLELIMKNFSSVTTNTKINAETLRISTQA